jgi:hypothetical protein
MRSITRAAVLALGLFAPSVAFADEEAPPPAPEAPAAQAIVVWPTLTPDDANGSNGLHRPTSTEGGIYERAAELDATLRDAVQDLGFALDVSDTGPTSNHQTRDLDMLARAKRALPSAIDPTGPGPWVVSARLEPAASDAYILRILAVAPGSAVIQTRVERVGSAELSVRGLLMLRDLLTTKPPSQPNHSPAPSESAGTGIMSPSHSPGRAVLAANAALFGAFLAYSVQRASGSEDPRLLYPLLTLGTGIGLGAALLVSEEWNVTTGDAWTIAGGAWWGTASGIFIANGRHITPLTDRYAWGVGGGIIGLSLATFSLTRHKADESDAVVVHSGAGIGLGLGALTNFFYTGDLNKTPYTGAGYGSLVGLVAGGTIATFAGVPSSRMMLIDLGAGLGAAAGAALGSPLVFEKVTEAKTRGFVGATAGGALAGGAVAWWLTRERHPERRQQKGPTVVPFGGAVGASATKTGQVPAYGLGVNGSF